jgi:hypothetical protein
LLCSSELTLSLYFYSPFLRLSAFFSMKLSVGFPPSASFLLFVSVIVFCLRLAVTLPLYDLCLSKPYLLSCLLNFLSAAASFLNMMA